MEYINFGSDSVITEKISESDLKTYLVGFDIDDNKKRYYRLGNLVELLLDALPDFAFAYHEKISMVNARQILREAAKSIYKIKEFEETYNLYANGETIEDHDLDKHYLKRGEFGELILHLLLRDFNQTIPLLSKIYFKDAYSTTVHGFDAVHIDPKNETLWLGESKLYVNGRRGIKALIEDVKNHVKRNYLHDEFTIVSKKIKAYDEILKKDKWLHLMDRQTTLQKICKSVTIPLLCTYSCNLFEKYDDENNIDFIKEYKKEMHELKKFFDDNNDHPLKTDLNIILLLFPVKCKNQLVKRMHEKLYHLQGI